MKSRIAIVYEKTAVLEMETHLGVTTAPQAAARVRPTMGRPHDLRAGL
jgi:hypothetical protein